MNWCAPPPAGCIRKLVVLLIAESGVAAIDDAEVDISVEQRRLGTVGIENAHERNPSRQHRLHFLKRLLADVVDLQAQRAPAPRNHLARIIDDHDSPGMGSAEKCRRRSEQAS